MTNGFCKVMQLIQCGSTQRRLGTSDGTSKIPNLALNFIANGLSLTGRLMPDLPECWEKLHKIDDRVLIKVEGTKQIVYSQKL